MFVTGDLKPTIRAPGVIVSPCDEHGLPYTQVFLGAAPFPFGDGEAGGLEGPLGLLLPLGELFCFLIARLVVEPFVSICREDCCDRIFAVNWISAPIA